uniref:Uncharacterized protein n=1 Tax=Megaviridae environmental sample TaxID=1737588 RepID=A0A5J6VIG5_9VIRU|nr:MAG: hypothetical protein [Megaviridae environmental sample]
MPKYKHRCEGLGRTIKPLKDKITRTKRLNSMISLQTKERIYDIAMHVNNCYDEKVNVFQAALDQGGGCAKCCTSLFWNDINLDTPCTWVYTGEIICSVCAKN